MSSASRVSRYWLALVGVILGASVIDAQWLKYPPPGVPRRPDGKPNLDAGHLVGK